MYKAFLFLFSPHTFFMEQLKDFLRRLGLVLKRLCCVMASVNSASFFFSVSLSMQMEIPASSLINRYIACQGPLPNTCPDFWRMTWEQGSSMVVMLTTQVERGRVCGFNFQRKGLETELRVILFSTQLIFFLSPYGNELEINIFIT